MGMQRDDARAGRPAPPERDGSGARPIGSGGGTLYVPPQGDSGPIPGTVFEPDWAAPAEWPEKHESAAAPPSSVRSYESGPNTGDLVGQYEIIRELGRGGMGVVYLARDQRLGRRVAVKLLQTQHPELTRRFLVEAQATAQCSHENIVVIHEVGVHQGQPFMVLEYLKGQTLAALLDGTGPLQFKRAVEIMARVLQALSCAHERGIVHRDLKPENIFLTDSGVVKVLDFGIAKVLREEALAVAGDDPASQPSFAQADNPAQTGLIGTLAYMSPEQWMASSVDHRTDIWAVGVIFFELLSGRRPTIGTAQELRAQVANLSVPSLSLRQAAPQIPVELAGAVDACLRKNPSERPQTALKLLAEIEPFLPGHFQPWFLFDRGPYTGLRSFQEEDAAVFFGRSKEVAALVARVHDWPLLAVVGPSGVGKSSFIRAGVVPALRAFGTDWQVLVMRPGRTPLLSLANALTPILNPEGEVLDASAQQNLGIRLAFEPGFLGSALRAASRATNQKYMIFVDQFEELYTLCTDAGQRRAFAQCLTGAADDATSPVRVVVSIRSDFLGRVAEDAQFMAEVSRGLFFLGTPGPAELREALVAPAEKVGFRFESEALVQEMLKYLETTPGALPLLQFTAAQMWESRDTGRKVLTQASYQALGGIGGALATHADKVVENLSPEMKNLCRAIFLQLVTGDRTRAVREIEELRQLTNNSPGLDSLIGELVEARLLVVSTGGGSGGATVELIHESLIEAWLSLRRWLEESHEDSMFLEQLRAAARQWEAKRRDAGLLWGGEMAEELDRFQRRFKGELPEVSRDFIRAVGTSRVRRAHLKRRLATAGGVAVVALLAAASVALVVISGAKHAAEKNAEAARVAQSQAQARLVEVQEKEKQRLEAEAEEKAAKARAIAADKTVALTNEELAVKNEELLAALRTAETERELATGARRQAEENERIARDAENKAEKSAKELEQLLAKERDRANRLSKQLGTSVVEVLR